MKTICARRLMFLYIAALSFVIIVNDAQADVEALLAEINRKPPEDASGA